MALELPRHTPGATHTVWAAFSITVASSKQYDLRPFYNILRVFFYVFFFRPRNCGGMQPLGHTRSHYHQGRCLWPLMANRPRPRPLWTGVSDRAQFRARLSRPRRQASTQETRAQPARTSVSPRKRQAQLCGAVVGPQIFRHEMRPTPTRRQPKLPKGSPRAISDSHRYRLHGALPLDTSRQPFARAGAPSRPTTSGPSARPPKATGPSLVAQRSARHTV